MNSSSCSLPPELTDDQLDEILDGELSPEIQDHLRVCSFCARRLERARTIDRRLQEKLHPAPEALVAYSEGELPKADAGKIALHIQHCLQCQGEINAWQIFNQALRSNLSQHSVPSKPTKLTMPVRRDFNQALSIPRAKYRDSNHEEIVGFEIRNDQYRALLSLRWHPQISHLTGFLIPEANSSGKIWEGAAVVAFQNDKIIETIIVNALGSFQLENLTAGVVTLSITSPDSRQFRIENLTLPPAP